MIKIWGFYDDGGDDDDDTDGDLFLLWVFDDM